MTTYTFESRKEIVIEAHELGLLIIDCEKDQPPDQECAVFFTWDRVPVLIETLQAMNLQWKESN
jgi:hypothetical protein